MRTKEINQQNTVNAEKPVNRASTAPTKGKTKMEKITNVLMNNGKHLCIVEKKSETLFFIMDNEGNEKDVTEMLDSIN
jgi:hypothetical protein